MYYICSSDKRKLLTEGMSRRRLNQVVETMFDNIDALIFRIDYVYSFTEKRYVPTREYMGTVGDYYARMNS